MALFGTIVVMKTHLKCIPCFFQQVADSSKLLGISEEETKKIFVELGDQLKNIPLDFALPEMTQFIQNQLEIYSNKEDPFYEIKQFSNKEALKNIDQMREIVNSSSDKLRKAVELACAGNIIDFGVSSLNVDIKREIESILEQFEESLEKESESLFQLDEFKKSLGDAKKLLFIGDNAGEIVFDKVLIETIKELYPNLELYFATRGRPIINDVLVEDAVSVGIDKLGKVVSSGVGTAGLALEYASKEFLKLYKTFDLIISKGQGNFECLSDTKGPIYFLLISKCSVITEELGSTLRQIVLVKNSKFSEAY